VPQAFLSAKKWALGGSQSSLCVALREELHSGKRSFLECRGVLGTRGRPELGKSPLPQVQHLGRATLGEEKCYLTVQSIGALTTKK
jgi:hypothetical protein